MLNHIEALTLRLSKSLLKLDIALPPHAAMNTSKINQISYGIQQMHTCLVKHEPNKKLFLMCMDLIFETTGHYIIIYNMKDLRDALAFACTYIENY